MPVTGSRRKQAAVIELALVGVWCMSGQPDLARLVARWASKADHDIRNAEAQPSAKPEGRKTIAHGASRRERNARLL